MGTPNTPTPSLLSTGHPTQSSNVPGAVATQPDGDPLAGFDTVLAKVAQADRDSAETSAHEIAEQARFLAAFRTVCDREVRPAMEAVLARLQGDGGGGLIEEHPGGEARIRHPRLVMWMSLEGDIAGGPRPDRYPYLQLDADVAGRQVEVSEGDMWRGAGGGRSGRIGGWQLSEITADQITRELLTIARRAAL